jgi:hypothetical protein
MGSSCRTFREEPSGASVSLRSGALVASPLDEMRVPETPPEQPPFGMPHLGGVLVGEPTRLTGAAGTAIREQV